MCIRDSPYPFGVAAVLSPWNYPLQLTLIPLVDAIGAGNCVAMKPSKTSPHTSQFLRDMCRELFDPRYVYCWHGSNEMNDWLLQVEFDKIMFTGSPRVGREDVYKRQEVATGQSSHRQFPRPATKGPPKLISASAARCV